MMFIIEHRRQGCLIATRVVHNQVTKQGLVNGVKRVFGGLVQLNAFTPNNEPYTRYGLLSAGTITLDSVMADIGVTLTEFVDYTPPTSRIFLIETLLSTIKQDGVAQSVHTSGSARPITVDGSITGVFLTTNLTKLSTTGFMFAGSNFSALDVRVDDTIFINHRVQAQSNDSKGSP